MACSYVYFITDGNGHIKIGKADDVMERVAELQTGNPYKLSVILNVIMPTKTKAFNLERELHDKFKRFRLEGEWFMEEPVLDLIDTETVEIGDFKFGGIKYGKQ